MSLLIAVTEASAKAVEVGGGMSLISSEFITALLTGIAGVVSTALVYFKMKGKQASNGDTSTVKVKRPIDSDDVYVTKGECRSHRCALEKRIDQIGPALGRLFDKLTEIDHKNELRVVRMHDRLEPVVQRVAANSEAISMLKEERRKNAK